MPAVGNSGYRRGQGRTLEHRQRRRHARPFRQTAKETGTGAAQARHWHRQGSRVEARRHAGHNGRELDAGHRRNQHTGEKGQCSNAAKLLCDASATDFDALVAGARAEAAAAAQQANEELAASEGPHDTEETGAEDQKSTPQGRRDTKQATKKSAQAGQNANTQAHKDADSATLGTYTQSAACGIAAALALTSANGNQRTLA
ncbi:hypothetical protein ERJ75_001271100 [Trypanosoma vivax]|nr:hypothetical protein ERJ75_001271100 [Trypanosoma vivax]